MLQLWRESSLFGCRGKPFVSRMLPTQSPITYAVLSLCCLFYGISLLLTLHNGGTTPAGEAVRWDRSSAWAVLTHGF